MALFEKIIFCKHSQAKNWKVRIGETRGHDLLFDSFRVRNLLLCPPFLVFQPFVFGPHIRQGHRHMVFIILVILTAPAMRPARADDRGEDLGQGLVTGEPGGEIIELRYFC